MHIRLTSKLVRNDTSKLALEDTHMNHNRYVVLVLMLFVITPNQSRLNVENRAEGIKMFTFVKDGVKLILNIINTFLLQNGLD